ncbi:MAG: hypothetical protein O7A64_09200 [Alphaproteobacteria bacterium]|nr:hypothetical protein [Alphaproteobacteria bacterium]
MFNMTGYVELKRLLTEVEAIEEKLTPNERDMLRSYLSHTGARYQTIADYPLGA